MVISVSKATNANSGESEQSIIRRHQQIYDASPIISSLWSADLKIIDCNEAMVKLLKLSGKNDYIERFYEFAPEYQACGTPTAEYLNNAIEESRKLGTHKFMWTHLTSEGEPILGEVTFVRIDQGDSYMFAAFMLDLREIEAAMAREHEAVELTRSLLNNSPYFMELWDADGNLFDCNEKILEVLNCSSKTEFTERFYDFSAPIQPCGTPAEELNTKMFNLAMAQGSARAEWAFLLPDGEELPADTTWVRTIHQGNPIIIVYSHDLRPLRDAERSRTFIYDSIPVPASLWDEHYRVLDCNEAMVEFLQMPDKDTALARFFEFSVDVQPCGNPSPEKAMWVIDEVLRTGKVIKHYWNHLIGGEIIPAEITATRVQMGEKYVCACYALDLREINAANQRERELEARLHEQSIKVAEESNRAKTNFLARMSHEIRTPITAVMGISEIHLQNPDLSPHLETSFSQIHTSANLLLSIVNGILDISKIEAGKMTLMQSTYDVASTIDDVTQMNLNLSSNKDITFRMHIDDKLPARLLGDALRIKQVVSNLLSNAFKYTESGSIELSWEQCGNDEIDGYINLVVSITDTGLGMTKHQLELLRNNEYTRFHEDDSKGISGTGLGMPIVYSLLDLMGASIEIESEADKGTKVVISIPQELPSETETIGTETADRLQQFENGIHSMGKKFTFVPEHMPYGSVLVVDDVEANLFVTRGLLAFYDLKVETCISGHEAIEKVKQGKAYDIVFMDYMMPGLNGTEAMRIMRDLGYTRPIVVLTANALIGQAEEFIKLGFDGYISKPIQTKQLNAALLKHIRDKQPPEVIEAARLSKESMAAASDVKGDIDDFQNSSDLVETLRFDFARQYANLFTDISNSVKSNDTQMAHLLTHTLKGAAGLIHETSLANTARHLEQKLQNGEALTIRDLSALESELSRVLADIGKPEIVEFHTLEPMENKEALALLNELEPLLSTKDARSLIFLDELKRIPGTKVLCEQIENFDFKLALVSLSELKGVIEKL